MEPQIISIPAPEGFKYEEGKPIQLPVTSIIPADYQAKPYMKKFESAEGFKMADFFKSFDEAQGKLGQKPQASAPAADAPDEEWTKFFEGLRPSKADEYQFEEAKDVPEHLKASDEYKTMVRQMFHEAGLSTRQAKVLQTKWDAFQLDLAKKHEEATKAEDAKFDEIMKKNFGDKAEEKIARARKVFEYVLPKEMHPFLQKLTNEQLEPMAVFANAMADKYIKEDELPNGGGQGGAVTVESLRKEAFAKMAERDKLDAMNPMKSQLQKEIDGIYEQIGKMKK